MVIRPIEPTDAEALVRFHAGLSPESTRRRFFSPHPRLSPGEVERFTCVDHQRREALVAVEEGEIVAVGRSERLGDTDDAEVAFVVADRWQHHGIGSELLAELVDRGRAQGVCRFVAETLAENRPMIELFAHAGYPVTRTLDHGVLHLAFTIDGVPLAPA